MLCDDSVVVTDLINRVLDIDTERKTIKVEAGIFLKDLNEIAWNHGLAFPSIGDIAEQSLAGLCGTATHGSGLSWGSLSSEAVILDMELVTSDGSLIQLSDHPHLLKAARLLGSPRVVYSLTLKLGQAHYLKQETRVVNTRQALKDKHYLNFDHFEVFPFAHTDLSLAVFRYKSNELLARSQVRVWLDEYLLENLGLAARLKYRRSFQSSLQLSKGSWLSYRLKTYTDKSYKVMASVRKVRFLEMEYAFHLDKAECLRGLSGRL